LRFNIALILRLGTRTWIIPLLFANRAKETANPLIVLFLERPVGATPLNTILIISFV